MYPKKKENYPIFAGYNQCHSQFVKEIKERADVKKIIGIIMVTAKVSILDYKDIYKDFENITQAIQTHFLKGLETA